MMMSFREKEGSSSYNRNKDNEQQQEEDESNNNNNNNQSEVGRGRGRASSSSNNNNNSSRQWSSAGLKNPRIVRVSRSFGGKDRHSKVCTIKGLRDRRIRLSVPTAIQLYDLQDRLGLSQPSKVIDWLLDTTKHDIDKLPPLPIIPNSSFSQGFGLPFASSSTPFFFDNASLFPPRKDLDVGVGGGGSGSSAGGNININSSSTSTRDHMDANMDEDEEESLVAKLRYWGSTNNAMMRSKHRGVEDHINEDQNQGGNSQVLAQNLFPIASHNTNSANNVLPPHPHPHPHPHPTTFLSNNNNPMFNYYHLEPSNLSLTQLGNLGLSSSSSHNDNHQGSSSHHHHSNSATQPPSSLSLSSMSQLFLCPSMATTSFFPQQQHQASFMSSSSHHHPQVENDLRNQFNRFPISNNPFSSNFHNSSGLDSKPFPLSMNHEPQLQQGDEDGNSQGKSGSGHTLWKEP